MLQSTKLQRRQSEIRQELATLSASDSPTDDQIARMGELDAEYRNNETRYRAALVAEDTERREAGAELSTRGDREWSDLVGKFELRQVALLLDEGTPLAGQTAEIVQEMRAHGGFQGCPVPWETLEQRAGETVGGGVPDPIRTMPIIDRLFASSVAARMGVRTVNIPFGQNDYPIVSSSVAAGWGDGELADVAGPTVFSTGNKSLQPNSNLGIQMEISRRSMKQVGNGLEQAVRRDMSEAIRSALDQAVFLGTGANGQPTGILPGASAASVTETAVDAAATWSALRGAVTRFLTANAADGPGQVRVLMRPEVWDALEGAVFDSGSGLTEWDRVTRNIPAQNIAISSNTLDAPTGSPTVSKVLLSTVASGVAPALLGLWGAVDLIRDPYTLAKSGQLKLTALVTADVAILRAAQLEVLTGVQD